MAVTVTDNDTAQVTGVAVAAGNAQLVVSWTAVDNATGYTVQWKSGGENYDANRQATVTSGSTTSHTIPNLANGTAYTVRVIATRTGANDGPPSAEVTSTPVAANTPATGKPTISGTAQVGETLTASTAGIADVDGLTGPTYTYQWVRVVSVTETDISGATDSTYTLVAADAGNTVKVKVGFTDGGGTSETVTSDAYPSGTATIVAVDERANIVPMFEDGASTTRSVAENTAADVDIGSAVTATDTAGDTLTYSLAGPDAASFDIDTATGQIRTKAALDYEAKSSYTVTVKANDGNGGTATVQVTITVTDIDLRVPAPTSVSRSTTSLVVTWEPRPNEDLTTTYDLRYRESSRADLLRVTAISHAWIDGPQNVTGTQATLTNLTANTSYAVQVRARRERDTTTEVGDWSPSSMGRTGSGTSDPVLRAWLSRFGRTVATHVTDTVGERMRGSGQKPSYITVGGYRLPLGQKAAGPGEPGAATEPATTTDQLASLLTGLVGQALGLGPTQPQPGGDGPDPWADRPEPDPRLGQSQTLQLPTVRLRDVLLGSSFRLTLGATDDAGTRPRLTAWGRVAGTQFDGRDGALTLDGNVFTGTVGVDGAWDRWLAGVAVSHSLGGGSFSMTGGDDDLDRSTLTSIHPYLRYGVNERVDVWGVLGYGWGDLTLAPGTDDTLETDMTFVMGAFGGRGLLLSATENAGVEVAVRTDAMLTRTTSGAVARLASAAAEAHRLRLVLEGSRGITWPEGRTLTPTLEVGLRHDWGDAETGFGLELGGRVQYADPGHGLTIEAAVRGLLAHEDSDYKEWGASGTIRIDPGPMGQGLALTLSPTWGAASSGVEGLWSRQTTAGLAPQSGTQAPAGRVNAQVGYGLWLPSTGGLVTPFTAVTFTSQGGSRSRVGLVFDRPGTWGAGLRVELAGERIATAGGPPEHTIGLQLQFRFGRGGKGPRVDGDSRGRQSRATPGRAASALDTVAAVPQTSEPTHTANGRHRAPARPHAAAVDRGW